MYHKNKTTSNALSLSLSLSLSLLPQIVSLNYKLAWIFAESPIILSKILAQKLNFQSILKLKNLLRCIK